MPDLPAPSAPRRLLVTAGATHEPIDAVRYLANRSSGRTGIAIADEAASRGWAVTLLLGPTPREPSHSQVVVHRFRTTADLASLLEAHFIECDALVMAAAVADYRPSRVSGDDKLKRRGEGLTLELESTPDLLARCAADRLGDQLLVGFALEPRDGLEAAARAKLVRKGVDLIVANPLETMGAPTIEATVLGRAGLAPGRWATPGAMPKTEFACWLMDLIEELTHGPCPFPRA